MKSVNLFLITTFLVRSGDGNHFRSLLFADSLHIRLMDRLMGKPFVFGSPGGYMGTCLGEMNSDSFDLLPTNNWENLLEDSL